MNIKIKIIIALVGWQGDLKVIKKCSENFNVTLIISNTGNRNCEKN